MEDLLFAHALFATDAKAAICAVLQQIEEELRVGEPRTGDYSGSTLALVLVRGDSLLVANIGDSRTILIKRSHAHHSRGHKHHHHHHHRHKLDRHSPDTVSNTPSPTLHRRKTLQAAGGLTARQLSTDHKPDQQEEYARILSCGGRVFSVRYADGVVGPARVWLSSANMPGLAMSRSLGDFVVHSVGVLSTPEFTEVDLDAAADCMLVLASDGLWDFLSNEEVTALAATASAGGRPDLAVLALLRESRSRWLLKEQMADDTTVCVVHLAGWADAAKVV